MGDGDVTGEVENALAEHFGHRPVRASVSFVGVEPIDVLRFEPIPGDLAYVTLGMSRHPMTPADADVQVTSGPRAELLLDVHGDGSGDVWRRLAVLAAAPAVEGVVYRPGMTVDLGAALAPVSRCTGVLTAESPVADVSSGSGSVTILSVLPATPEELAWCRVHGAEALRGRWRDAGIDTADLARSGVPLG